MTDAPVLHLIVSLPRRHGSANSPTCSGPTAGGSACSPSRSPPNWLDRDPLADRTDHPAPSGAAPLTSSRTRRPTPSRSCRPPSIRSTSGPPERVCRFPSSPSERSARCAPVVRAQHAVVAGGGVVVHDREVLRSAVVDALRAAQPALGRGPTPGLRPLGRSGPAIMPQRMRRLSRCVRPLRVRGATGGRVPRRREARSSADVDAAVPHPFPRPSRRADSSTCLPSRTERWPAATPDACVALQPQVLRRTVQRA